VNKNRLEIYKSSCLSSFKATFCGRYFTDYASDSMKVLKITISMLNNFITIGFRSNISIARVYEVIPMEYGNVLIFDL
jgi:hypothetical protein